MIYEMNDFEIVKFLFLDEGVSRSLSWCIYLAGHSCCANMFDTVKISVS